MGLAVDTMARAGIAVTSAGASSVAAWLCYDYQTMHGMRKFAPWSMRESTVRLLNSVYPPSTEFTLPELQHYNGTTQPHIYFSAKGVVFDVTDAESFQPDGAYGKNWAGRDATLSLALMSLDAKDVNRQDWSSMGPKEVETLDSWLHYFDEKYRRVGVLREYRDKEDSKRSGELWLENNAAKSDVMVLPSGLQYSQLQIG